MSDAINEYETTNQSYEDICSKYGINRNAFFYHLRKHRITNQQTLNGGYSTRIINSNIVSKSQTVPEVDNEGNKLVCVNTNSKKMQQYMKQHDVTASLSSSYSEKTKNKAERVISIRFLRVNNYSHFINMSLRYNNVKNNN